MPRGRPDASISATVTRNMVVFWGDTIHDKTTTWVAMKNKVVPGIRTGEGSNPQRLDKGVEAHTTRPRAQQKVELFMK